MRSQPMTVFLAILSILLCLAAVSSIVNAESDLPIAEHFTIAMTKKTDADGQPILNQRAFSFGIDGMEISLKSAFHLVPSQPIFKHNVESDEPIRCTIGLYPFIIEINQVTGALEIPFNQEANPETDLHITCKTLHLDFSSVINQEITIRVELLDSDQYSNTLVIPPMDDRIPMGQDFTITLGEWKLDDEIVPNRRSFIFTLSNLATKIDSPFVLTVAKPIFLNALIDQSTPLECKFGDNSYTATLNQDTGVLEIGFQGVAQIGENLTFSCKDIVFDFADALDQEIDVSIELSNRQVYKSILTITPVNDGPEPEPEPTHFCNSFVIDLKNEFDIHNNPIPNVRLFTFAAYHLNEQFSGKFRVAAASKILQSRTGETHSRCLVNDVLTDTTLLQDSILEFTVITPIPQGQNIVITCQDFRFDLRQHRHEFVPIGIFEVDKSELGIFTSIEPIDDFDPKTDHLIDDLSVQLSSHKDIHGKKIGKNTRNFKINGQIPSEIQLSTEFTLSTTSTNQKDGQIIEQKLFKKREKSTTSQCTINTLAVDVIYNEDKSTLTMKPVFPISNHLFTITCPDYYLDFSPVIDRKDVTLKITLNNSPLLSSSVNFDAVKENSLDFATLIVAGLGTIIILSFLAFCIWKFTCSKRSNQRNGQEPLIGDIDNGYLVA